MNHKQKILDILNFIKEKIENENEQIKENIKIGCMNTFGNGMCEGYIEACNDILNLINEEEI